MLTQPMMIAIALFIIVYAFIVSEKFNRMLVVLFGSMFAVLLGVVPQNHFFKPSVIDYGTLVLLISTMILVIITSKTGFFEYIAIKVVKIAKGNPIKILIYISLITAFSSAFLNNVTIILLILPIVFDITKELKLKPIPFVVAQIFASNVGGTATLIGDPPNIMIGNGGSKTFMDFIFHVAPIIIPIMIFTLLYFVVVYRKSFVASPENMKKIMNLDESTFIKDKSLLIKSISVLSLTIVGFLFSSFFHVEAWVVSVIGALILLSISKVSVDKVLQEIEWNTIFFFTGLFVLVAGLDITGVLEIVSKEIVILTNNNLLLLGNAILWFSAIVSAFVDNIPLTATMIPVIKQIGQESGLDISSLWWALSLGACLGGNGTVIGASANVVALGMLEEHNYKLTFWEYFKVCFPAMIVTIIISTVYLTLRYLI